MRSRARLLVAVVWVACGGTPPTTPEVDGDLTVAAAVPFFTSPFAATDTFRVTNFFDHAYPNQFSDNNGYQLLWFNDTFVNIDGHNGYDWIMPVGTPLLAVADGDVIAAGVDPPFSCPPLGRQVDDQRFVEIRHFPPGGVVLTSVYVHLESASVAAGDVVTQGQVIGFSGNTGCSTEPHLHFHVWRITGTNDGTPTRIDPYGWYGPDVPDPWAVHPNGAPSINLWSAPPPLCLGPLDCYPNKYADVAGQ